MIDAATAADVWGSLARVSPEALSQLGIGPRAAYVLGEVGLPVAVDPLFVFTPAESMPSDRQPGPLIRFGTDGGSSLCLVPPDGAVISVPATSDLRQRYVNTDLGSFASFLLEVCRIRRQFAELDDTQLDTALDDLQKRLRSMDETALADPEHWWSVIFEQLRDGLL